MKKAADPGEVETEESLTGGRKQQKKKWQQSVSLRAATQMCASPALDEKSVTASRSEALASN